MLVQINLSVHSSVEAVHSCVLLALQVNTPKEISIRMIFARER